jgi:hypothetical protein
VVIYSLSKVSGIKSQDVVGVGVTNVKLLVSPKLGCKFARQHLLSVIATFHCRFAGTIVAQVPHSSSKRNLAIYQGGFWCYRIADGKRFVVAGREGRD